MWLGSMQTNRALSLELVRPFGPIPSVVSSLGGSRLGSPVGELSAKQTEII